MVNTGLLQLEVVDFFGGYVQFFGQKRQKRWVVTSLDARGESRLLVRIVLIEFVRDLAENRNELRLLVEREFFVNVPVDLNTHEP